ncbi:hypothetical protein Hanom_Chr01g00005681 [Helianthus anomalus]
MNARRSKISPRRQKRALLTTMLAPRPNFLARRGNCALSQGSCALILQVMVHAQIPARFLDS